MTQKQNLQNNTLLQRTKYIFALILLFANTMVGVFGLGGLLGAQTAQATIAKLINFQGKLTAVSNGTNVANGTYAFEFKLYTASSGGSLLWTETFDQPSGACSKLTVTNGVFNAKLGSCNSLGGVDFTTGSVYLTVNFAPTGTSYDGEMSPRKQLLASTYAFVANSVSGDGVINTANQSATALTVGRTSTDAALQVDTNTASSTTGLKVTSAAAGGGIALTAISSGTNENLTLDAKGSGTLSLGASSTGDVLLAGGSGATGCTVANSTGNLTCTGNILGATTGTAGYWTRSGTLLSPATAGDDISLPTGDFIGLSSSTARLVFNDAARDNVTLTDGDLLFSADNTWDIGASGATRARTIYAGTSVIAPTINATTTLQLGGTDINTVGTLTNVAYENQANVFTQNQTIQKADPSIVLDVTTATDTDFWLGVQDDAGGDDDDVFQIGDGTSVGTNPFLTINTSGNVGIGDTSPAAKFFVSQTDSQGAYTHSLGTALNSSSVVVSNITSQPANHYGGFLADTTVSLSSASGAFIMAGLNGIATIKSTDSATYAAGSYLTAGAYTTAYLGTGSIPDTRGLSVFNLRNGSGAITNMDGINIGQANYTGSGTISRVAGAYLQRPVSTASSTITNAYGVYIENQTPASGTLTNTAYGIYQAGTGDYNYFGGNVGIGTTAPDRPLEVNSVTGLGMRLTYNDVDGSATNFADLQVSSAGALHILPSGFIANVGGGTTRTALRFLEPSGTGTDYAAIQANSNVTTSYTWTLPAADASGCIQSNGSGVLSIASCGGGSLTPWTSNIDADGFALQDALNLEFRTAAGSAPAGTVIALYADNSGDLTANVLTGKTFNIAVNGTDEYNFSSTALAMNSNNITGVGTAITATAALTVTATAADLTLATATSGNINLNSTGGTIELQDATNITGALDVSTTLAVGTANAFQIASNGNLTSSNAGTWTFSNDTDFTLSGGINGLSFDGTTFSVDATNNRIGIGTAAPTKSLDISLGGGSYDDNLRVVNTNTSGVGAGILFDHYVTGAVSNTSIGRIYSASDGGTYTAQRLTLQAVNAGGSLADVLTLKNNRVGINNSTPVDTLEVRGAWTSTGGLTLANTANSGGELNTILFYDINHTSVSSAIAHKLITGATDTELQFYASTGSTMSQRMVIQGSGNVGIGITAPTSLLHVQQYADSTSTSNPIALNVNSVGAAGELTASSGVQTFAQFAPVINQSSSAGYNAVVINATETATGSGSKNLLDLQVGGASVATIQNDGDYVILSGGLDMGSLTHSGTSGFLRVGYAVGTISTANGSGEITLTAGNYRDAVKIVGGLTISSALNYITNTNSQRAIFDSNPVSATHYDIAGTYANFSANRFSVVNSSPSAGQAIVITDNATVRIDGAPTVSGGLTQTNAYALLVAAGTSKFGGDIQSNVTGSTQCLQANSSGIISGTGSACGSGGGLTVGTTSIASGTIGAVLFQGSGNVLQQDATNYFWDDTNNRLGLGTNGPDRRLDVLDASNPQLRLSQTDGSVFSDFQVDSNGDLLINIDGATNQLVLDNGGNVGIGDASPNSLFTVGNGDLFQINTTGQIGSQQAPVSDYLFALAGTTGNDNSRIIDITQANDAAEDSTVINLVNTANPGTLSTGITRTVQNISSSLTPTIAVNGAAASPVLNVYGVSDSVSLSSVTLADVTGANSAAITASSLRGSLSFNPIINDTGSTGFGSIVGYGAYSSVTGAPTLTSVTGSTSVGTYGGYFSNTATSAGNANLTYSAIGVQGIANGNLTTTGGTEHYGGLFLAGGTADTNYGIYVDASGATNNYAGIFTGGNVGIGITAPTSLLHVQQSADSTDITNPIAFDINSVGSAGELTASSGGQIFGRFAPVINQSSTASYRALDINVTETAVSGTTGLNRLADFRVGSSSRLAIANNGSLTLQNAASLITPNQSIGTFQNHLVRSDDFGTTWTVSSVTAITNDTQVAPDGSTSAESLAGSGAGGYVQQDTSTAISSDTYTFSVWARSTSGTQSFDLRVDGTTGGTGTAVTHTATTSWQRFSVTQAVGSFTGNIRVRIYPGSSGTGTIYAWGAQLEKSTTANAYAKTTGAALTNNNRGTSIYSNLDAATGFNYGNRNIIQITTGNNVDATYVGQFIRVIDNDCATDCDNTTKGLEVQAYSGSNIAGTNMGIDTYGYTFGIKATTTAQASNVAQPAAVFADLDNGSATTTGNAIRAFTDNATSATLVSFYQEASSYTGTMLALSAGNNSGSFDSGNFLTFTNNDTSPGTRGTVLSVDYKGLLTVSPGNSDNTVAIRIDSEESTDTQALFELLSDTTNNGQAADTVKAKFDADGSLFVSLTGTQNTVALCHATNGQSNNDEIVDCSGAPSDVAEYFGTRDASITAAEVVVSGEDAAAFHLDGYHTSKAWVEKTSKPYDNKIIGVVSTSPAQVYGDEIFSPEENPRPIALIGRVPVKVTMENGEIKAGDYLTSSSTPGYAMKSTRPGMVIGQAISGYNGNGEAVVMVFVNPFYYDPTVFVDGSGNVNLQRNTASTILTAATDTIAAQVINQQGSGDILQLQNNGVSRFLVQNNGSVNINVEPIGGAESLVLDVRSSDDSVFTINARGDLGVKGVIIIKEDSFAGSVTTGADGTYEVTFAYNLGTGKPVVQLTPEAQLPVFALVQEFKQDANGNYTGFVIKTYDVLSLPIQSIVHFTVFAKQAGYQTIGVVTPSAPELIIIEGGEVVGGDNGGTEDFTPINPDEIIVTDNSSVVESENNE